MKAKSVSADRAKRIQEAENILEPLRDELRRAGVVMRSSTVTNGPTNIPHWMFNDEDGRRLVNYWPTSGRWNCPLDSSGGDAAPDELARIVMRVACSGRS